MYTPSQTRDLAALSAAIQLATTRRDWSISDQLNPKARHPAELTLTVTPNLGENTQSIEVKVQQVDEDVFSVRFPDGEETQVELDWQVGATTIEAAFSKSGLRVVSQVSFIVF